MKFGVNTFVWEGRFTRAAHGLVSKVKEMGFDIFEVAVEEPSDIDAEALRAELETHGLGCVVCGIFGPGRDLSSDDPAIRSATQEYLAGCIELADQLGATTVCGPMYASVGKARILPDHERRAEWERARDALREMCDHAARYGVRLALEPLNRFETDMINTVEQALELIAGVGRDNLGIHADTFHMHLEERDTGAALRRGGDRIFHVHACENDRGVPGLGQVDWRSVADGLAAIGYDGDVVIESFTPEVESIARAACIWRPIAPSQDAIAEQGLAFLQGLFGAAAESVG